MLHTTLLRLINTREAWALVGSGPSIEAGCPSWDTLVDDALGSLDPRARTAIEGDAAYQRARKTGALPAAFQSIEDTAGRPALDAAVRASLARCREPGALHGMLAQLPFAGYITTNYDDLLEQALNRLEPGWTSVGNVGDEVRKASGTAERVVWHIHGSTSLPTERSRLLVTQEDYDQLYLDESPVLRQLKGLMANRRVVVVGFGFRDAEVMRMMRAVGRFTDYANPIYALVEKAGEFRRPDDRRAFLRSHHIDAQPYQNADGRHGGLRQTLAVYTAMSLRRSLRYGRHLTEPPSYDPETTGLLIYNDLAMAGRVDVPEDLRGSILRSRVLSVCEDATPRTQTQILSGLDGLVGTVTTRLTSEAGSQQVDDALNGVLRELVSEGLLQQVDGGGYRRSALGHTTVADHVAASQRLEEQFDQSIAVRIKRLGTPLGVSPARPAKVVGSFFREAIRRRALGVALAFATGGSPAQQDYHALALLQSVGEWLDAADDEAEALVVIDAIQEVFREPSGAESNYIGAAVQARFVLHLLGLDEDTLRARMRELADSLFLIDSTTLIPWIALGGVGHDAATVLLNRLRDCGAVLSTTSPLVIEAAEHARWAQRAIREAGGVQSVAVFEAATGRAGTRSNAFLDAYLSHVANQGAMSFDSYLARCLSLRAVSDPVTDAEFIASIATAGVAIVSFDSVASADSSLPAKRTAYEARIRTRRMSGASYKHDRQVRAEGEAVLLVELAREGSLDVAGRRPQNGYFLTYTSLLNDVAKAATPVTLKPEAALSWLATLRPASRDESHVLVSEMLWELQERRMNLVDQSTLLAAFGPLISAAKKELGEVLPKYQALVAQRYGGESIVAPSAETLPDLDVPVALDGLQASRLHELEALVAEQASALERAEERVADAEVTSAELEKMRRKQKRKDKYDRRMRRRDK